MAPLYSRSNYFSTRSQLKSREQELLQVLRDKLSQSSIADDLFEYLAVRVENERVKCCKELNSESQGRVKELTTLIELFSLVKSTVE